MEPFIKQFPPRALARKQRSQRRSCTARKRANEHACLVLTYVHACAGMCAHTAAEEDPHNTHSFSHTHTPDIKPPPHPSFHRKPGDYHTPTVGDANSMMCVAALFRTM